MSFLKDQITSQIQGIPGVSALGQIAPVSRALYGGNIVSILLRQEILRKAFRPKLLNTNVVPVFNPRVYVAGVIPVSARTQEVYTFQADVTEHAVESGVVYSDHIIVRPMMFDCSFEISNWTYGDAQNALEVMQGLVEVQAPIDIQTEHKILQNMACTYINIVNEVPEWGKLVCRASFKQMKLVTLQSVKYPEDKVTKSNDQAFPDNTKDSAEKSAVTAKNKGNKRLAPKTVDDERAVTEAQQALDDYVSGKNRTRLVP